jgi:Cys-tRNA synthase (O-phospho-L-seryl-tRNA:Cys-tRNA synthase)
MKGILKNLRLNLRLTLSFMAIGGAVIFVSTLPCFLVNEAKASKYYNSEEVKEYKEEKISENEEEYESGEISYEEYAQKQANLNTDLANVTLADEYYKNDADYQELANVCNSSGVAALVGGVTTAVSALALGIASKDDEKENEL